MFVLFALLVGSLGPAEREPPPDELEIQRQVTLAQAGDRPALGRLYGWHVARVARAVRPWCGSDADAEDVTQETFVRAFGALDRYEPVPGARFVSWLLTIARNVAKKRGQRAARTVAHDPEALTAAIDRSAEGAHANAEPELASLPALLLSLLAELDERDRWVVCLRYGGELEAAEVSEITGLSPANVRKICERQRQRLLARLEALGVQPGARS
jgi:RNA polymerase sigma-70 factor, ECF subfamily